MGHGLLQQVRSNKRLAKEIARFADSAMSKLSVEQMTQMGSQSFDPAEQMPSIAE